MTKIQNNQNKLSQDNILELFILEDMEIRTRQLCNELQILEDQHLSWSNLLNVLSPSNPTKLAEKLYKHYRKDERHSDRVFNDIYVAIENIDKDDYKFWHYDVLWLNSIATLIYDNFRDQWRLVVEYMRDIHRQQPISNIDFVFVEAILTLREKGLISNELFSCDVKVKWHDGVRIDCENSDYVDDVEKMYMEYYSYEGEFGLLH